VTLNLLDSSGNVVATKTTDANGAYRFDGLAAGTYTVVVTDTNQVLGGLTQSADPDEDNVVCSVCDGRGTVDLADGASVTDIDFGYRPTVSGGVSTLGGTIWLDDGDGVLQTGEPGIQGVTVELWLDNNGNGTIEPGTDNLVRTTTTDANGNYQFLGLPPGDYIVNVTDTNGVTSQMTLVVGPDTGAGQQRTCGSVRGDAAGEHHRHQRGLRLHGGSTDSCAEHQRHGVRGQRW
jgi:hypothetical protein